MSLSRPLVNHQPEFEEADCPLPELPALVEVLPEFPELPEPEVPELPELPLELPLAPRLTG